MTSETRKQWLGLIAIIVVRTGTLQLTKAVLPLIILPAFRAIGVPEPFATNNAEGIAGISGLIAFVIVTNIIWRRTMIRSDKAKPRRRGADKSPTA